MDVKIISKNTSEQFVELDSYNLETQNSLIEAFNEAIKRQRQEEKRSEDFVKFDSYSLKTQSSFTDTSERAAKGQHLEECQIKRGKEKPRTLLTWQ